MYVLLEIFSWKNAQGLKHGLQYSSSMPPSKTNAAIVSLSEHSQTLSKHLLKKRIKINLFKEKQKTKFYSVSNTANPSPCETSQYF